MKGESQSTRKDDAGALEIAAREAIERQVGVVDDRTWGRTKERLIEFVLTLERWDRAQRISASEEEAGPCRERKRPAA
jgi:hypothetical protein